MLLLLLLLLHLLTWQFLSLSLLSFIPDLSGYERPYYFYYHVCGVLPVCVYVVYCLSVRTPFFHPIYHVLAPNFCLATID